MFICDKVLKCDEEKINELNHKLNPLHMYCRLRDIGIKRSYATRLGKLYENSFYKLYKKTYETLMKNE